MLRNRYFQSPETLTAPISPLCIPMPTHASYTINQFRA
jgi:hypothetical protein